MRFLSADVQSFMRFTGPFTLPLARQGLVLVEAEMRDGSGSFDSNGAGKSSLLEGVFSWSLFGKMPRYGDERLASEEVCYDGHEAFISVAIESSAGLQFLLSRRRRPAGAPSFRVSTWDAGAWAPVTTVDDVTSLLGFDYATLRHALFLQGNGLDVASSGFASQMRVLESILRFDVFNRAAKITSVDHAERERFVRDYINELDRLNEQARVARGVIADLESLDESVLRCELEREISAHGEIASHLSLDQEHLRAAQQEFDRRDAEYMRARDHAVVTGQEIKRLEALDGQSVCPTCRAPLTITEETLRKARRADGSARVAADRASELRVDAAAALTSSEQAVNATQHARDRVQDLCKQLEALRHRQNQRLDMIVLHREKLSDVEARLAVLIETIADARRSVQVTQVWKTRGIEEMKAETLGAAGPYLNDRARYYSDILTDGELSVQFDTRRDSRSERMIRISGASAPTYAGCSSGERRRIDLIVALSLRACARWRLGDTVNVAVWDEVFDALDERGLERVVQFLQRDVDELDTVFVVTHHPRLKEMFPGAKTMKIIREQGKSRVEWP